MCPSLDTPQTSNIAGNMAAAAQHTCQKLNISDHALLKYLHAGVCMHAMQRQTSKLPQRATAFTRWRNEKHTPLHLVKFTSPDAMPPRQSATDY